MKEKLLCDTYIKKHKVQNTNALLIFLQIKDAQQIAAEKQKLNNSK